MHCSDNLLHSRRWYVLAAASVLSYLFLACWLTDSTPKFDDLNDVFGFFKQLALAQTPLQKIGAFFYPNNEHVTAFSHLIYFLQYQLLGEVCFYGLTIIGHLIIIATAYLLGCAINSPRRPFYFAVTLLGYLNLYYWDSSFKAMTAISNQVVILFALATFFALLRVKNFALAIAFAVLATFSQGNGVLAWLVGALFLFFDTQQPHRFLRLTIWLLAAIGSIAIFTIAQRVLGQPSPLTLSYIAQHWQPHYFWQIIAAALAFLGSTIFSTAHTTIATVLGFIVLLASTRWLWRDRQRDPLITAILLFLLLSTLTASMTRGFVAGAEGTLESRYKMYSLAMTLLLGCACIEYWLPVRWRLRTAILLLLTALSFQLTALRMIPAIQSQAQRFQATYPVWLEDGDFRRQAIYFPPMSDHFLFVAQYLGVIDLMQFVPQEAILRRLPAAPERKCPPASALAAPCSMTIRHRGNAIAVVVRADSTLPALPATVTLCDTQTDAVMEFAIPETPTAQQTWLIPEAEIPAGQYRVLIQPTHQAACETVLTKKPRKVETEMRTLFKDTPIHSG
ncbi:MAG: hypothetical protein R3E63_06615 [Pseudomonadales bacterium]